MSRRIVQRAAMVLFAVTLAACAHRPASQAGRGEPVYQAGGPGAAEVAFGVVQSVERISTKAEPSGAGAAIGAVAGAVVGRQFGFSRDGRAQGTLVGTFVGAVLGNEMEKMNQRGSREMLRVTIMLDQGGQRRLDVAPGVDLRAGDRVRVENGQVVRV